MLTFVIAQRTIIHQRSGYKQKIPRSRTLTSVYDRYLEDILAPAEIIGKRTRFLQNGSQILKVHVSEDSHQFLDERKEIIENLYYQLTHRRINIEFKPQYEFSMLSKKTNRKRRRRQQRRE